MVMRARCWARRCGCRWMSGCGNGSSLRRAGIRLRCWSCRGGRRRPSWRADSVCRTRRGCRGGSRTAFGGRFARLPAETQRLLLVAAAEPVGDPVLVWRAAERLGIGVQAAAETDGLLAIGARVTFRHPLVRSAVYRAASPEERQAVHRALADATDPRGRPRSPAWHLAQATPALTRTSPRARALGGPRAGARRIGGSSRVLGASRRADARALAAGEARARRGAGQAPSRRVRRGPRDWWRSQSPGR